MRTIRAETVVDWPPSVVWAVLSDFDAYDEWNPHITSASGELREGEAVSITVERSGRTRDFRPTVTTFDLKPLDDDRTLLVNREETSGLLVPLVAHESDREAYESMNWALAERIDRERTGARRSRRPTDSMY